MPKISIVVPIYKVEPYLRRCIDSILTQTFCDFEAILVDDGSPDNCPQICDEYEKKDSRIHVIHQKNGGLSSARNAGLDWIFSNSNSNWITFIDSDDWIYPQYLEYLYRAVKEENVLISVCKTARERKMFHDMKHQSYEIKSMTPEEYWVEYNGEVSVAWEKLYKKELFENIRFPVGMIYEDEFTTYKVLFSASKITVLENCLYIYYYSETSIIRSKWNEKKFSNIDAMLNQIEFFKNNGYKRAEHISRKRLANMLKIDYSVIKAEPEKYGKYKKIIEGKLEESYKRMHSQITFLPVFHGKVIKQMIVLKHGLEIYWTAFVKKIYKFRI